ncbi:hypothetical protein [Pseudomonas putida]|uniref:hypothetical protein n=1 Tax=Pseudomonas putida TaxID=303 RepID=UPI0039069D12
MLFNEPESDLILPVDNKPAKQAIKPLVNRRKAWLFSETSEVANPGAQVYCLVKTDGINGQKSYTELRSLLE